MCHLSQGLASKGYHRVCWSNPECIDQCGKLTSGGSYVEWSTMKWVSVQNKATAGTYENFLYVALFSSCSEAKGLGYFLARKSSISTGNLGNVHIILEPTCQTCHAVLSFELRCCR